MITREELERMYWREGESTRTIAKKLGVGHDAVIDLMVKYNIPRRSLSEARSLAFKKKRLTPTWKYPDLSNRLALSYIIGVLLGDGHVRYHPEGGGLILLCQTKKEFAKSFEDALKKIYLNPRTRTQLSDYYKDGFIFYTTAHSRPFVDWYLGLSLQDKEKIVGENKNTMKEFIRGFYESEGTNYIKKTKIKGKTYLGQGISICSFNEDLLDLVAKLLKKLDFDFGRSKRMLRTSRTHQVIRFVKMIKPCIKNRIMENPPEANEKWSKEKVINELKKFVEVYGFSPTESEVRHKLLDASVRYFGSFNKAKKAAGIQTFTSLGRNFPKWSKEKVIEEAKKLVLKEGHLPSPRKTPHPLRHAAYRYIGSWNKLREAIRDSSE